MARVRNVKPEQLGQAISDIYDEYQKDITKVTYKEIKEYAEKIKDRLVATAPRSDRDIAHMADGFVVTIEVTNGVVRAFVHNTEKVGVVHLVELGTYKMGSQSFMRPAFDEIAPQMEQAIANAIRGI